MPAHRRNSDVRYETDSPVCFLDVCSRGSFLQTQHLVQALPDRGHLPLLGSAVGLSHGSPLVCGANKASGFNESLCGEKARNGTLVSARVHAPAV